MSNPDYWQERAEKRIHRAHRNSDKTIKEITAAYQQAIDDINSDIEKIFYRYAGKNDLSSAEAKDILNRRISENEWNKMKLQISSIKDPVIKKQLRAKLEASAYGARIDRLEALKQDIYIKTKQVADVELQKSTELYRKTVEDNYLHNVFDFQQGTGYAYEFASMSPEHIEEILKNNWSGKHYSKSVWDNTDLLAEKLQQTLTAGLMSGKSYKRMAAELTELTSYGQYAAERLIRTETAYLIEESDKAAAIDRGTKVRIFRATLDRKTSKACQEHDGDRVPIEESVPGKNVPPLHPHCRSWMEEEIEGYEHRIRAARDTETGERITIPANMTYTDWKDNVRDTLEINQYDVRKITGDKKAKIPAKTVRRVSHLWDDLLNEYGVPKKYRPKCIKFLDIDGPAQINWKDYSLELNKNLFRNIDALEAYINNLDSHAHTGNGIRDILLHECGHVVLNAIAFKNTKMVPGVQLRQANQVVREEIRKIAIKSIEIAFDEQSAEEIISAIHSRISKRAFTPGYPEELIAESFVRAYNSDEQISNTIKSWIINLLKEGNAQ